jgi:SAM-dependent methyltransferase
MNQINNKFIRNKDGYYTTEAANLDDISYPKEGNGVCFEYETTSQWFQARNKTIEGMIKSYPFKGDFLDVGGGNGFQLKSLQEGLLRKEGVVSAMCEPGPDGCRNAVARGVENVYCTMVSDFPFEAYKIDGIGLFDVIEHIENDTAFMTEISRFLPAGSRIYITVPAMGMLWSSEDVNAGHFRRYNNKEVKRLVDATGLNLVHKSYFFSYYVPFVFLLRVIPEFLGKKYNSDDLKTREKGYHEQSRYLSFLLNFLHWLESAHIKVGLKPFWGTSMMVVLEKR